MIVSEINIKLSILGYWGVGKTSITNVFTEKELPHMYIPTLGSNIVRKEYKLEENHIRVNIWDIGGQRSFNPLNPVFFSNIDASFLVFDLTNPKETLTELKRTYLENLKENSPDCIIFLIGNKADLIKPEETDVLLNNIRQSDIGEYPLIFTSAKTEINLLEAFELIIFNFLKKWEKESNNKKFQGISNKFISSLNKNEEDLLNLIVNLEDIDSTTLEKKITPKIVNKRVSSKDKKVKKVINEIDYTSFKSNIIDLDILKENILSMFHNNLNIVEDLVLNLKNTPINSLLDTIDKTYEELDGLKDDFKLKLENVLKNYKNKKK